jgi:hypothetical protein
MPCYDSPMTRVPASNAKVSTWLETLLHLVDQIMSYVFPHTAEQDSQHTTSLISKQVVPYQTRGSTCCLVVSTPMIRSLADSSMANHITWRNPTVSTIPTLLKPRHRSSLRSRHSSQDGRPNVSTITQAKLNIIKMERFVRHSWLHD